MSKPFTETDVSNQLAQDRNWRLKEISDLKSQISRSDEGLKQVLLRSLVAICYAHWEGFVRFAARRYMEHIALRRLKFADLDRQFLRNYFVPRLAAISISNTSLEQRCELIDEILNASNQRFSKVNDNLVSTRANLSFAVFSDICLVCGVPVSLFEDRASFIDVFLLKRRNEIAHGENTFVAAEDVDTLASDTITLMRNFGDALENQVYLKAYSAA